MTTELEELKDRFVDKFYEMNPDTEDLIPGEALQQGMHVLVADSIIRENPNRLNEEDEGYVLNRLLTTNQWCTVTYLRKEGDLIHFIGVYDDGVKRARTYHRNYHWIVKL